MARKPESVKFITCILAIVAALCCAAFASPIGFAVHSDSTSFHRPDKPTVAMPEFHYEGAIVLRAFEFAAPAMPDLPRVQGHCTPIIAVTNPVKTKGVAPLVARGLAVARSSI